MNTAERAGAKFNLLTPALLLILITTLYSEASISASGVRRPWTDSRSDDEVSRHLGRAIFRYEVN
jgi:hypothetical protein